MTDERKKSVDSVIFINQGFDPYDSESELEEIFKEARPINPLPPIQRKISVNKNLQPLYVLPSIDERKSHDTQKSLLTILTLAMGIEASYPPLFYERLVDVIGTKINLSPQLLSLTKKLLYEEEEHWSELRDEEMKGLVQSWAVKSK